MSEQNKEEVKVIPYHEACELFAPKGNVKINGDFIHCPTKDGMRETFIAPATIGEDEGFMIRYFGVLPDDSISELTFCLTKESAAITIDLLLELLDR